jgi:hypothetical protein
VFTIETLRTKKEQNPQTIQIKLKTVKKHFSIKLKVSPLLIFMSTALIDEANCH